MAKSSSKDESSEPLKYQTWVLKVPIHCEGCKQKVRKKLQSIDGVYEVKIEPQNKVIVSCSVSPDILIKKLQKHGKHVEIWSEKKDTKPAKSSGEKKGKESKPNDNGDSSEKKSSPAAASKNAAAGEKNEKKSAAIEATDSNPGKTSEESAASAKQSNTQTKEPKKAENSPTEEPTQPPAVENSGSGKKNKKKGKKADGNSNNAEGDGPTIVNSGGEESSARKPAGGANPASPPRQHPHQPYGYAYPPPHQPVYVMSYNTAQPSMSYGGSYYVAPPAYYAHHVEIPETYPASASGNSYDMFSDENPNGCSVM